MQKREGLHMKKALIFLMIAFMLTCMFACSKGEAPGTPTELASPQESVTAAPIESNRPITTEQPLPTDDESPYKLAEGKYETDENGVPKDYYTYELPLSTTDEVFTYTWLCMVPNYIPEEGYESMEFPQEVKKTLGVNIEYNVVTFVNARENFSARLAADDLCDLTFSAHWYYPGSKLEAIDDGYFANLYDYKQYMPNYYRAAHMYPDDVNVLGQIMPREGTIPAFYAIYADPMRQNGPAVRGDWLRKVGLTQKDIVTIDQYEDMLRLFKTEIGCPSPYLLLSLYDAHAIFACYDTHAYGILQIKCVRDGKVSFAMTAEQDKHYLTTINEWWNEGLILKDYLAIDSNPKGLSQITTGQVGALGMIPSEKLDFEKLSDDPDMDWVPLANPVLYEGQTIHLALRVKTFADGSWWISTKCDNIPLLMTYCDYFYSSDGIMLGNYGVNGFTSNYDENGEIKFADWIVNHPAGFSNSLHIYCLSELVDGGFKLQSRSYAFEGGGKIKAFLDFWADDEFYHYDGAMEYPSSIVLTAEQSAKFAQYKPDVATYLSETIPLFIDGSKSLDEWDSYVAQLREIGLNECESCYQEAYDAFIASMK